MDLKIEEAVNEINFYDGLLSDDINVGELEVLSAN